MATYKGAAYAREDNGTGQRSFSVAWSTAAAPGAPADRSADLTETSADVPFIYSTVVTGVSPPPAPESLSVILYSKGDDTIVARALVNNPTDGQTINLKILRDYNEVGYVTSGATIFGTFEIYFEVQRTSSDAYSANSREAVTGAGRGWLRVSPNWSAVTGSLTATRAAGGARSGTHALYDTQTVSASLPGCTKTAIANMHTLRVSATSPTAVVCKSKELTQPDSVGNVSTTFRVDADYPLDLNACKAELLPGTSSWVPDSEAAATWYLTSGGAGVPFDLSASTNVDPRISFRDLSRTSAETVVNYGRHTVTGQTCLDNAVGEAITSSLGSLAAVDIRSRNSDATLGRHFVDDGTPDAAGLITWSAAYTGPSSSASRNVGPDNDKAANTAAGDAKRIYAALPNSASLGTEGSAHPDRTTPVNVVSSSTFVSLSSLLTLTAWPQHDSTLDTTNGRRLEYTMGLHSIRAFGRAVDVAGSAVSCDLSLRVTDAATDAVGSTTVRATGADGWTSTAASFDVADPEGPWQVYSEIAEGATGAQGNYGSAQVEIGVYAEVLRRVSAWTFANLVDTKGFSVFTAAGKRVLDRTRSMVLALRDPSDLSQHARGSAAGHLYATITDGATATAKGVSSRHPIVQTEYWRKAAREGRAYYASTFRRTLAAAGWVRVLFSNPADSGRNAILYGWVVNSDSTSLVDVQFYRNPTTGLPTTAVAGAGRNWDTRVDLTERPKLTIKQDESTTTALGGGTLWSGFTWVGATGQHFDVEMLYPPGTELGANAIFAGAANAGIDWYWVEEDV